MRKPSTIILFKRKIGVWGNKSGQNEEYLFLIKAKGNACQRWDNGFHEACAFCLLLCQNPQCVFQLCQWFLSFQALVYVIVAPLSPKVHSCFIFFSVTMPVIHIFLQSCVTVLCTVWAVSLFYVLYVCNAMLVLLIT